MTVMYGLYISNIVSTFTLFGGKIVPFTTVTDNLAFQRFQKFKLTCSMRPPPLVGMKVNVTHLQKKICLRLVPGPKSWM